MTYHDCRMSRGDKPRRSRFRSYPIGFSHIDIAEVRTEQGRFYIFVTIDRTRKFALVELHEKVKTSTVREFLEQLIAAVPYTIHTVPTDNGIHFTTPGAGSAVPLIRDLSCPRIRVRLRHQRYRSPHDQAKASLDQWLARTDEPYHQGCDGQTLQGWRLKKYGSICFDPPFNLKRQKLLRRGGA